MIGPAANEFVLSSQVQRFSHGQGYPGTMKALLGPASLSALDGLPHKQARQSLAPAFGRSALIRALPTIEAVTAEHRRQWQTHPPVDWHLAFRHLTMDMMTTLLLGRKLDTPVPDLCRLSGAVSPSLSAFLPLHWRWWRFRQACQARDALLARLKAAIPDHYQPPPEPTALSLLLAQADDLNDEQTRQQLGLQLLFLLFAGHETLSTMLASLQRVLSQRPEVAGRIRAEQRPFARQSLAVEQLQQMSYLTQVLMEVERLYPTIDGLFRGVRQPFTFNGFAVPPGWLVACRLRETHQDPQVYRRPKQFDPDRFGPERAEHEAHRFSLVGFGGGPRICLGKSLALLIMKVVAVHLLRLE